MRALLLALALAAAALAAPPAALAVQPDEVLEDPALETRAREISSELRCLVCRNESIDDSNAELARDLRLLVRERLVAGDSDDEVVTYLVDRYGEYVLLRPTFSAGNLVLWLGGPALLVLGGVASFLYVRRARPEAAARAAPLSAEEQARLDALLEEEAAEEGGKG
jgi:cytochrome c-type biogenesis protein CcmH